MYQIKPHLNGIYKIRIKSKYLTITLNTNTVYTQSKLEKFYQYKEMKDYIEIVDEPITELDASEIKLEDLSFNELKTLFNMTAQSKAKLIEKINNEYGQ